MIGTLILRLTIWFLLTSDLSLANIVLGVCISLLLPRSSTTPEVFQNWLRALGKILITILQAYLEAFEIIIRPHTQEDITIKRVQPRQSPRLIFLDLFIISFTPKTIVFKYDAAGWYKVHRIHRRQKV